MTKQEAKKKVAQLVEYYHNDNENQNIDEATVRRQFISPFFKAFGWDVDNENLLPQAEKLVRFEENIQVGDSKKNPDYTFCYPLGKPLFYLEAKRPSVNVEKTLDPAFQVRSYGWSAGLYISVLTNFAEFAIYNTKNIEPIKFDQAAKGRVDYFRYTDYVEKFDYLWDIFAFENVENDSIIQYAKQKNIISETYIKGTVTVDDAFLRDIEAWRRQLAKEIFMRQSDISKEDLNYAVQKIIDRIIFLRFAEDRELHSHYLKNFSQNYEQLCKLFKNSDNIYNSGLFHFSDEKNRGMPDTITPSLKISATVIQDIINPLYDGKYKFKVMPAYILGSVYERFLGQEINLDGKNARIELKPAVRKAGGVYYTPEYIVEYIVKNTIQKRNENIKILDPACGSGSFLLVAYQYMLEFYQRKHKRDLTLQERKQILLDHIFGVDIDEQAVEVTKLSLLLKVLENVSKNDIDKLAKREKALPSLHNNIKCGNSLIDDVTVAGEKAFVWEKEFADIFDIYGDGGFDVVIGNPPYVNVKLQNSNFKNYINSNYNFSQNADIYIAFYEKATQLIKQKGRFGFITPNKFFGANYGKKFREYIQENLTIEKINDVKDDKVFKDAQISCIAIIFRNQKTDLPTVILKKNKKNTITNIFDSNGKIQIDIDNNDSEIIRKLNNFQKLGMFAEVRTGIMGFEYWKMQDIINNDGEPDINKNEIKLYTNGNIGKYEDKWKKKIKLYNEDYFNPTIILNEDYLSSNTIKLFNNKNKIIVRGVAKQITATIADDVSAVLVAVHTIHSEQLSNKYLLGVLNSKLINWLHIKTEYSLRIPQGSLKYSINFFKTIPIPRPNKRTATKIIKLVDQILKAKQENKNTKYLEAQIDNIVYEMYNLSIDEINYIENLRK